MSPDSSNLPAPKPLSVAKRSGLATLYVLIVAVAFVAANFFAVPLVQGFQAVFGPVTNYVDKNLAGIILTIILYIVMLVLIALAARLILKEPLSKKLLGFVRGYRVKDALTAIAGFAIYFVVGAILMILVSRLIPGFNADQAQDIGFSDLGGVTKWLVFVLLVIVDPIFEESIFRGFLYGKMREKGIPIWVAAIVTSIVFGAAHGQWNVGVNVGALSLVLCLAREYTGSLWASITLHGLKNAIAFFMLFM